MGSGLSLDHPRRHLFSALLPIFGALYASVKNEGKSMGLLIEQYIGKTGKKLFLSVLLALYFNCNRRFCRHGCWYIQCI